MRAVRAVADLVAVREDGGALAPDRLAAGGDGAPGRSFPRRSRRGGAWNCGFGGGWKRGTELDWLDGGRTNAWREAQWGVVVIVDSAVGDARVDFWRSGHGARG